MRSTDRRRPTPEDPSPPGALALLLVLALAVPGLALTGAAPVRAAGPIIALDAPLAPDPPDAPPLTSSDLPGFRVWVVITPQAGPVILGGAAAECIPETLCVTGALPDRPEVFVRVVGPKPNGYLWPTLVKFSTSTIEIWIEQAATGQVRYYRLEGAAPGLDELPGLFDRTGFLPQ
jgi:MYXO-CTERM domain-containing protein